MALSFSVRESGTGDGDFSTGTIAPSYTPVIVVVSFAGEPGSPPYSPVVSGCNLTWNLQTTIVYSSRRVLAVFEGTGSPTSGTLSISATDGTRGSAYAVLEADNIDAIDTWAEDTGSGSTSLVTVSGSGDATLSFHAFEAGGLSPSPETGSLLFTEDESNDVRMLTGYLDTAADTTPSVAWGTSDGWGAVGALFTEAAGGSTVLVVADATHSHTAENVALTQKQLLTVAETLHDHTADNLDLVPSGAIELVVADATHSHTADNITIEYTAAPTLVVAGATHGHTADNIAILQAHLLAVADATHDHTADTIDFGVGYKIYTADLYTNLTPVLLIVASYLPNQNINANPSPTEEVYIG